MSIRIAAAVFLATAGLMQSAGAQPVSGRAVAPMVGRYDYRDAELVGFIDLRADGTFTYKVDGIGRPVEGERPFHLLVRGLWRSDDRGRITLTNVRSRAPVFRKVSAVRDPGVRAALNVMPADGIPAGDLGLLTDGGADGAMNMLSNNSWVIPLRHAWNTDDAKKGDPTRLPRNWEIVRAADQLTLAKIALTPTGPNRFVYRYTRSAVAPFRLAARLVDGNPGTIEVEFGSAGITMHRAHRN